MENLNKNRAYSGSVSVPSEERHWNAYEGNPGQWLVAKSGGFSKVYQFKSKEEAEQKLKELKNQ